MRTLLTILVLAPTLACAQAVPPAVTEESVTEPAPGAPTATLDGQSLFNSTEIFHRPADHVRIELQGSSGEPGAQPTPELHAEAGLTDHLQLSLGQAVAAPSGQAPVLASAPIALRYSPGTEEGNVPGNLGIEVALIPRVNAPARAALRLLAAKEVMPGVGLAVNGYLEQNLDRTTPAGVDGAFGMSAGISAPMVGDVLRIGGEAKLGEAQYGQSYYTLVAAMEPDVVLHKGIFVTTASVLVDLVQPHVDLEPMLTTGLTS